MAGPRLVATRGPLAGSVFPIEGEVAVGRDPANQVVVPDAAVSRRHCRLAAAEGEVTIADLESSHGTFVNGSVVERRVLRHGDRVRIGGSELLFLADDAPAGAEEELVLTDSELLLENTVELGAGDLRASGERRTATEARAGQDLEALLRVSAVLSSAHEREPLARRLLEILFDLLPADRGALLLAPPGTADFETFVGEAPGRASSGAFRVSRTVVQKVLDERVAVRVNNLAHSVELQGVSSLEMALVRSVLCVPLLTRERALGVLYADIRAGKKDFDDRHLQLAIAIGRLTAMALEGARVFERLEAENRSLRGDLSPLRDLVGESAAMREVYRFVARAAPTDSTVLVRGESGTGKELVARAIHERSPRASGPFVAVNCAALGESLLESEMFGHERGAFTGAVARKTGRFELADQGTLFLDEVGEMAPALQAKLLRALQEREFERVGGTRPVRVDVRVVAATNRDLEGAIREGRFREDLYYRLNVLGVHLPPLRQRREDIPLLVDAMAVQVARRLNRRPPSFSAEARACLAAYDWPGNVRELQNAVERALVLSGEDEVRPEDLPEAVVEAEAPAAGGAAVGRYHESLNEAKRRIVLAALEESGGRFTEAAKRLGLNPNYLHRLVNNLGLRDAIRR